METPLEESESLETARTHLELIMLQLDSSLTSTEHQQYLAGYIDCLNDTGQISDEERDVLYAEYAL